MNVITQEQFHELITKSALKPRQKRELRFVASTAAMNEQDWHDTEMVAITERSDTKGVLLLDDSSDRFLIPYELKRGMASNLTGRAQPIICDLCRTWQSGSRAGSITFPVAGRKTISYLCCADLRCSAHVRSKTSASKTSRSQLREDISTEERIERLQHRLRRLVTDLAASAL